MRALQGLDVAKARGSTQRREGAAVVTAGGAGRVTWQQRAAAAAGAPAEHSISSEHRYRRVRCNWRHCSGSSGHWQREAAWRSGVATVNGLLSMQASIMNVYWHHFICMDYILSIASFFK